MTARGTWLAALVATTTIGAAPAPAPPASYTVDVATMSGLGAGIGAGQPSLGQMMNMMSGGGGGAVRTIELRLSARNGAIPVP